MSLYNFDNSQQFSSPRIPDNRPEHIQNNPQQSSFNHNNPDFAMAEKLALENLKIGGAWVTVIPRTDDNKYDKTWNEDPDPTYFTGFDFKAFFAPQPPEISLGKYGHDGLNQIDLRFSRSEVLSTMGERLIRIGDVIIVPHNSLVLRAERFRVTHVQDDGNFRYRWIYLNVTVENMNKDESIVPRNS